MDELKLCFPRRQIPQRGVYVNGAMTKPGDVVELLDVIGLLPVRPDGMAFSHCCWLPAGPTRFWRVLNWVGVFLLFDLDMRSADDSLVDGDFGFHQRIEISGLHVHRIDPQLG